MNAIIIRPLKKEDADDIITIYAAITQKPKDMEFKKSIESQISKKDNACFVATLDQKVVGFMISYVLSLGFGIEKSAWIATFGVNPENMGMGIGASLAKETLKYYKRIGIQSIFTSVRWDSTDILSFFKTLGFDRSEFINLRKTL